GEAWLRGVARKPARGRGAKHRRAIAVGATRPLRAHRAGVRRGASIFWSNSAHKRVAGWTSCGGDGMNAPPIPGLGHERVKKVFLRFFTLVNAATFGTLVGTSL